MKTQLVRDASGVILPALATLLAATTAHADAECYKGYRDTTDAERATMTAVLETVRDTLPGAPEGWLILGDDQLSVPRSICMDAAVWTYRHTRYYQRVDDQEAQQAMIQKLGEAMKADMAAKQPRLDAIMARNVELSQQAAAAGQAGDYERVEAINTEIQANGQNYQDIMAEGGAQERANAELEESGRDREMSVSAEINPGSESGEGGETIAVPIGAGAAYMWRPDDPNRSGSALVLLGRWVPAQEYGLRMVRHADSAPESAQAISVRIQADAKRLQSAVDAVDFKALAALLQE
jgi:hypothetical protein